MMIQQVVAEAQVLYQIYRCIARAMVFTYTSVRYEATGE